MIRIVLADTNMEYLQRLEMVLAEYKDLAISIYSDKAALENALRSKKIDILLFGSSIYEGQVTLSKETLAIMLYDAEEEVPESLISFKKVNKYQRIGNMYQQIMYEYSEYAKNKGVVIGGNKTQAIAFYSPVGGSGKTTLALATALKLAAEGKKTFFLSFEDAPSDGCVLPSNNDKGMSEIAAAMYSNVDYSIKIQGLLQQKGENLFYLKHFDSPNDIYELTGEERSKIIEIIENTKLFDVIVVDMGSSMKADELKIFDLVESIVLVERNTTIANGKLELFLAQAHIVNSCIDKMVRVVNFHMGSGSGVNSEIPVIGMINASQNPESAGFIEWLANQSVMNFALQLVK
ncbi:MAG: hypothetical protein IKP92_09675 [Lachnospiraceae bacterium]|nr:hypothetical protein [Lachnospiraceae bacterium]